MNTYLDSPNFPAFDQYQTKDIEPAIDQLLRQAENAIHTVENTQETSWDTIVSPLETATEQISKVWGVVSLLNAVVDTPELREVYAQVQPKLTDFWTRLGQNMAIFKKYQQLDSLARKDDIVLDAAQQKAIHNALLDFRLSGAELAQPEQQRLLEIKTRQAELSRNFSDHCLDANNAYRYVVHDADEVLGIPEDALTQAADLAKTHDQTGWMFTLQFPSYFPVMQYAQNRALRETLYKAYVTRASELAAQYAGGELDWDNTPLMKEILALRQEEARLLGFDNYAQLSLKPKMADTPEQVIAFLEDMSQKARPFALQDYAQVEALAKDMGIDTVQPWDLTFVSEILREQQYSFSEQEVKQYFTESKVLQGLFATVEQLFGVRLEKAAGTTWHPDAHAYQIVDQQGQVIAHFYLDLYARQGKRSGAWMGDLQGRRLVGEHLQKPIAYLVCNFGSPVGGKEATFTHDEVITLFHEFGHGLHHMLTEVNTLAVSGINGVEWDAVELPSQFMENFCWDYPVLEKMTSHIDTGAALPKPLFDKMLAAKNFQSGLQTIRQMIFSIVDMKLHSDYDVKQPASAINPYAKNINDLYAATPQLPFNRWPNTFSHIFAGGYAAGYYSYKWAEVLSSDVFGAFEEAAQSGAPLVNPSVGAKYRQEILAVGGSRPALESFIAFRGREPSPDALLRHSGMAA